MILQIEITAMVNILYVLKSKSKYILPFDCSRDIYVP